MRMLPPGVLGAEMAEVEQPGSVQAGVTLENRSCGGALGVCRMPRGHGSAGTLPSPLHQGAQAPSGAVVLMLWCVVVTPPSPARRPAAMQHLPAIVAGGRG